MALINVGAAGIETISGAMTRPRKKDGHNHGNYLIAIHRVAATTNPNCQRVYSQDADTYKRTTPLSANEQAIRLRFTAVSKAVALRKNDLSQITDDQIAFEAQKNQPGGKKTMLAYLWSLEGATYDQAHPRS